MPGALDILSDVRERLGDLPSRVVEFLRQSQPSSPALPASADVPPVPAEAGSAVARALQELPQPALPANPGYEVPQPALPATASYDVPQPALPAAVALPTPDSPATASASVGPAPFASAGNDFAIPPSGGGPNEVVGLLRQLVAAQGQGTTTGKQRAGRGVQGPVETPWSASWQAAPPPESFAGGASPSIDASNRAGLGGASGRRGFGSDPRGSRYWQPDVGDDLPR